MFNCDKIIPLFLTVSVESFVFKPEFYKDLQQYRSMHTFI